MRQTKFQPPSSRFISKHRPTPRQSRGAGWLATAALAVLLVACGGDKEDAPGLSRPFLGGAVADEPRAALAALETLNMGGSAADAAVVLYSILAVTLPSTASLGSGGVCMVYDARLNRTETLDFLSRAPAAGGPIAAPAALRGLYALHARYGRLRWGQLLGQAETMARFGHPVSRALAADLLAAAPLLRSDPELRRIFLRPDGAPYQEGQSLVQLDLATLLSAIRARGVGELYSGPVANQFIEAARTQGARIEIDDMRGSPLTWRPAVNVPFEEFNVQFPSPPAAAGLVQAQLWGLAAPRWRRASADERPHLFAQAGLRAWFDRARWLAPDLTTTASPPEIVSTARLNSLMSSYRPDQRTPTATLRVPRSEPVADDAAASGFITLDRDGNAVACTVSSYGLFGAGRIAPGTGVVLGRTPDGVSRGPQWLGPMIAIRNEETRFTLGIGPSGGSQFVFAAAGSGGAAASSALISVALQSVIEKKRLEDAIDAPRIHIDGAPLDTVFVEAGVQARPPGLAERGYTIVPVPVIGRVNAAFCSGGLKDAPGSCQFRADRRGFGMAASGR